MSIKTVTVGIPAYNEEANIKALLKSILAQKTNSFKLKSIIVISDGSTDTTVRQAEGLKSSKVRIVEGRKRVGKAERQNRIISYTSTDALVLLDADILIRDQYYLEKLVKPILSNNFDLTSGSVSEIDPENLLERILKTSMDFKRSIFESHNKGINLYTCHGRARAFSKKLYKQIRFKDGVVEDAYSYLYARANNFNYKFVKGAKLLYKLPAHLADHEKQSIRFYHSSQELIQEFDKKFIEKEYELPIRRTLVSFSRFLVENPMLGLYLIMTAFLKLKSNFTISKNLWDISETSKRLGGQQILSMSVIIPTCYGGDSLVKAVESIRQSDPDNLIEIVIVADTVPIVGAIKNKLLKLNVNLIQNKHRGGQFKKIKQGLSLTNTDLVTFAQDDTVYEKDAFQKIQEQFLKNPEVSMVSINDTPLRAKNIIEVAVNVGYRVSNRIRSSWNNGQNYIQACGRSLSFRSKIVKKFNIPDNLVNGDAYLYFENKRLGGKFNCAKGAIVYYRNPSTISEHLKKSSRYQDSSIELVTYFGKRIVPELQMPKILIITAVLREFLSNPFAFVPYVPLVIYTRFFKIDQKENLNALWKVELSTKS